MEKLLTLFPFINASNSDPKLSEAVFSVFVLEKVVCMKLAIFELIQFSFYFSFIKSIIGKMLVRE